MAEAAGLALGGIALVSLITTCVDFIEYFEDCRHCIRDITIAMTKVKLMKVRLHQLGRIGQPPVRHCLLEPNTELVHRDWHHVSNALPDGASAIRDIIQETTQLCRKYSYSDSSGASITRKRNQTAQIPSHQESDSSVEKPRPGRLTVLHTVSRSVIWALHDKRKFNGLISDFDCILSSLEKVIEGFQGTTTESDRGTAPMADKSNISKKRDGLQARSPAAPTRGAHTGAARMNHPTTPGGPTYQGNDSRDDSVHFVGVGATVPGDGLEGHRNVRGAIAATYLDNVSHNRSLAVTGAMDGKDMVALATLWRTPAVGAAGQKAEAAKEPVEELKPKGVPGRGDETGDVRDPGSR
ncbi:hypothetical protein VPNG_09927 [Cytospora leucostoma]|uniref:Prion-inhibition and propagation HeLo domain-containing protein n=1 Tax=Cytospora leucostoma TaxID=1230097 RepID=A0A423VJG2_9PEZI|nr:hypothetical protein VPNG_09927 [Cytospora leucostoma]